MGQIYKQKSKIPNKKPLFFWKKWICWIFSRLTGVFLGLLNFEQTRETPKQGMRVRWYSTYVRFQPRKLTAEFSAVEVFRNFHLVHHNPEAHGRVWRVTGTKQKASFFRKKEASPIIKKLKNMKINKMTKIKSLTRQSLPFHKYTKFNLNYQLFCLKKLPVRFFFKILHQTRFFLKCPEGVLLHGSPGIKYMQIHRRPLSAAV